MILNKKEMIRFMKQDKKPLNEKKKAYLRECIEIYERVSKNEND